MLLMSPVFLKKRRIIGKGIGYGIIRTMKKGNNKKIETRDQYTVVLEDLRSNFKVFGEGLSLLNNKVDKMDGRLDGIDGRLDGMDGRLDGIDDRLDGIDGRLDGMDGRLGRVESDLAILKGEVALIRHNQVTRDEFKLLESRVLNLEKKISH